MAGVGVGKLRRWPTGKSKGGLVQRAVNDGRGEGCTSGEWVVNSPGGKNSGIVGVHNEVGWERKVKL